MSRMDPRNGRRQPQVRNWSLGSRDARKYTPLRSTSVFGYDGPDEVHLRSLAREELRQSA